jgi:hypothetical protein
LLGADLCNGSETRVLVSFELRSSAVKETFLQEARKAFTQVTTQQQQQQQQQQQHSHRMVHSSSTLLATMMPLDWG